MPNRGYPDTVAECLNDWMKFRVGVVAAVTAFRRERPWSGTLEERKRKFARLNEALAAAYEMPIPELRFVGIDGGSSGASSCRRRGDGRPAAITMRGRLSVVTFLHEFAHFMYEMELTTSKVTPDSVNAISGIHNWFKRNADDVAKEANGYLGKVGGLEQGDIIDQHPHGELLYHGTNKEGSVGINEDGVIDGPVFLTPRKDVAARLASQVDPACIRKDETRDPAVFYSHDLDALQRLTETLRNGDFFLRQSNLEDLFLKITGGSLNVYQ